MSSAFDIPAKAARDVAVIVAAACAVTWVATRWSAHAAAQSPTRLVAPSSAADVRDSPHRADPHVLRVCADPNNLPFSNEGGEGFENAVAELVARDLGRSVEYYWQPQRRGFIRTTLKAGYCDVVMGVPSNFELARPTRPYYRSSYVFVTRRDRHLGIRSFDDARLRSMRIGIQITGEDYENPPPAHALAARHLADNVRGYPVYGDYSNPSPQRPVLDAVAAGDVDAAVVWGPLAGYFAAREPVPLVLQPIRPEQDGPAVSFVFDISAGVRRDDRSLHDALDAAIARRAPEIRRILQRFGVPLIDEAGT